MTTGIDEEHWSLTAAAVTALRRSWWILAFRGALGIVAGAILLGWPGVSFPVLFGILGAYLFADGMLVLTTMFRGARDQRGWWPYFVEGMLSICVGMLAYLHPAFMKIALLALIGARSVIAGGVEVAAGISLRRAGVHRPWTFWLAGLASLAFGVFLIVRPASAALLLVVMAGLYAIVFGGTLLATAFRLRRSLTRLRAGSLT